jgi:hypothetical protein
LPGSERYEFEGKVYAGYKDTSPSWVKGEEPKAVDWTRKMVNYA